MRDLPHMIAAVWLTCLLGCDVPADKQAPASRPSAPPAVPVEVARIARADIDVSVSAIGWVEPSSTVTIRPQVDGLLVGVHFQEGDDLTSGQLLFSIDSRSYEAALHLAEANAARDTALALDARQEADRLQRLLDNNQGSPRERDRAVADADAKEAQVRADAAEVERARLQVEHCAIRSPFAGRAGPLLAHRGSVVKDGDTALVVLNELVPIYVTFSIPERHLAEVRTASEDLKVHARLNDDPADEEIGMLSFIDNEVDRSTGMIRLKATFENKRRRLWPGQFVDVRLITRRLPQVVVAPASAVQAGQDRAFIFVVNPDRTVEARTVHTGLRIDDRIVIADGLAGNELVVTDGQLRLSPGAEVSFRSEPRAPAEAASR